METVYNTTPIEKYRMSDSGDRIFLFLEHRDLRPEFSDIDIAEAKLNRDQATEKHRSNIPTHRWLDLIKNVLRAVFSDHTSRKSDQ